VVKVERAPADRRVSRAAWGTALVFTVSGAMLGTWVSRLPATRDRLHASPAQLGLALLAMGIGSLVAMPSVGRLCRWLGSRRAVIVTALPCCAALFALAVVPSVPVLAVALFGFGLLYGCWDVSMNVQGSVVEQRAGRAWMPLYHGCWSVGGIIGALLGGLAAYTGLPVPVHFAAVAIGAAALILLGVRAYLPDREDVADEPVAQPSATRAILLNRRLLIIGAITLCSVVVEGAAGDWLAIYFVDARHTTASLGAAGYATFAAAMATGRFAGTAITERLGRAGAVRVGGLVGVGGVVLTILGPGLPLAYVGAVFWAFGVCLIFPAAISAAGESPDRPTDAIAAVSSIGYGGILVGPPLIGILADHIGLGRALLVLVVLAAAISVLAPAVRPIPPVPAARQPTPEH
jgi:predicted MFS family arabinose efflux permease